MDFLGMMNFYFKIKDYVCLTIQYMSCLEEKLIMADWWDTFGLLRCKKFYMDIFIGLTWKETCKELVIGA
jgi:hypothetical protein